MFYYVGICFVLYLMWVSFISLGVIFGFLLGDVYCYGFDMVFVVVFLVLLCGMWKGFSLVCFWFVSFISVVIVYLYLLMGWYVFIGVICGIVFVFLFI